MDDEADYIRVVVVVNLPGGDVPIVGMVCIAADTFRAGNETLADYAAPLLDTIGNRVDQEITR